MGFLFAGPSKRVGAGRTRCAVLSGLFLAQQLILQRSAKESQQQQQQQQTTQQLINVSFIPIEI